MPKTAAQTQTDMGTEPVQNVAGGIFVHIDLVFDGLAFNPANLLTALRTQYGATKVAAETDGVQSHNIYRFRIIP